MKVIKKLWNWWHEQSKQHLLRLYYFRKKRGQKLTSYDMFNYNTKLYIFPIIIIITTFMVLHLMYIDLILYNEIRNYDLIFWYTLLWMAGLFI